MSREGVDAGLSVAIETFTPDARISSIGATPQPRYPLERGQCATPTPCAARSSISSRSASTQCAAIRSGPSSPSAASSRIPVSPGGGTRNAARGVQSPAPPTSHSRSAALSARCVARGSPSSAQARYTSTVHVYGACGETPTAIRSESSDATRSCVCVERVEGGRVTTEDLQVDDRAQARRGRRGHAAPEKLQSPIVVMPERRHSCAPTVAIATMSSSSSAALRRTCMSIQGTNGSPSPNPA